MKVFANMTVRMKLILLSGLLLVALAVTNYLGLTGMMNEAKQIGELSGQSENVQESIATQQELDGKLALVNNVLREFGELKYWLTDLAASWQGESEDNATTAQENLNVLLNGMRRFAPKEAERMRGVLTEISEIGIQAVDAYVDENRVLGNSLLAKTKALVKEVDDTLIAMRDKFKEEALDAQDVAVESAEESINVAGAAIVSAERTIQQEQVVLAVIIVASILLTLFIVRSIIVPIRNIVASMTELSGGNLETAVPPATKNEIGEMAGAVQVFKDNAIKQKELEEQEAVALKQREERMEKMNTLTSEFDSNITQFLGQLEAATGEMQSTSGSLSSIAEESSAQAGSLASATESASNNVNTVASAAEELSASISEITQQITRSTDIAQQAVEKAKNANSAVTGLLESADKIGEVIELINDIAEQINLLALNATIEAARAGEAGKGFAVVASEVKNLATQTANATAEIASHISSTQEETRNTASVIEEISKTIDEMNEISTAISAAMEEQGAATQEIARSTQSAAASTSEVSSTVGGVSEAANQTGAAATEMNAATENMAQQSVALKSEVEKFLTDIKEA